MTTATASQELQRELLVQERGPLLLVTINRPHARNAVTTTVAQGIADALDLLDARDDLRVGVLTGAGGTFCAGMDLKGFLRGERPSIDGRGFAGLTESPPRKPLVAAVEGYALAGGCEIVLACDLVVAARTATFGIPEVKRGLVAAGGGLLRLPHLLPRQVAMELALTGDHLDASRAHALGLVNVLAEDGAALQAAITLAERVAANSPVATEASKRIILEHEQWPAAERFVRQRAIVEQVLASDDAAEGARAFAEKRPARWSR
jgi:enoyl-CoA hydratase